MPAVIFDYFFTLAEPALADFDALAERLGCAAEDIHVRRRELLKVRPLTTHVFEGPTDGFRSFRDYWVGFGDELFGGLGVELGGVAFADDRRAAHESAVVYPDVRACIDWLRANGWRIGVLSDADDDYLHASIEAAGLAFDAVLSSQELGCYKPHRSCFEAACEAVGVVELADAIYVGDSPVNDVEGSRRAGLRAVWLNRRALDWPADLAEPDVVIDSLAALPGVVS